MIIWFDLAQFPHINMFQELIRDLQAEHKIIITARSLANTVDLLELHRPKYTIVGRHYGASTVKKIMGFRRAFETCTASSTTVRSTWLSLRVHSTRQLWQGCWAPDRSI